MAAAEVLVNGSEGSSGFSMALMGINGCYKLVWLLIDGKRSIYDIALEMAKGLGDIEEVSIERLVMYIRYIVRKG